MTDRIARRIVLTMLERIHTGRLTVVEGTTTHEFGSGAPQATLYIHTPRVWRRLLRGSRGLGESYMDGQWTSPDVTAVIRVAARNATAIDDFRKRLAPVRAPLQHAAAMVRPKHTRENSRKDISEHYDLGNELFALMLDPTMMYSSALFTRPGMSLEEASVAKLDRICDQLDLGPDDHVVEIGTGWGGFAVHAARTRGCRVTTTTISKEQRAHAIEQVRAAGLEDRVTVLLDDYRDLLGTYDKLVSIEMIEAVGWKHFGTFFEVCSRLLKPDGVMALQAIMIDDRAYDVEKAGKSFITTYIFPNGCLPSLEVISRNVARRTNMQMLDLHDMTPDYAETLRRWHASFLNHQTRAAELGYDERFRRLWTLYLSYVEAGFAERRITVAQMTFAKPEHRTEPAAGFELELIADAG